MKNSFLRVAILSVFIFGLNFNALAQSETFSTGAFIINMGASNPNTIANGLKPYGMIYDLIRNYKIPVRWVISQTKLKDGVDFVYNGIQYKGGTFIIPSEYRTTEVNTRITYWTTGQGVVGVTTTLPLTLDVTYVIRSYPNWTLDVQNGAIAEGYLINAGITNTAFPGAYNWKSPQTLGSCDDFFVMPHAEPTWATHSNLLAWNRDYFGTIWSACHAVSALENMVNPANTNEQTNFLTTKDPSVTTPLVTGVYANSNSLLLWTAHASPTAPFITRLPNDPIAQFMGAPDAALIRGSEIVYIPRQTGGTARWNPGVKIINYDPSQSDVTAPNPDLRNAPALIVYGRAFDDPTRGYVMYEAGHSMAKGTAGDIAGQRAFFNFSFFQTTPKAPQLSSTGTLAGLEVSNGTVLNYAVSASSPMPGITFTYAWSSTGAGTFSNSTAASTTFTPAAAAGNCIVTCVVTDNCGRKAFQSFPITILPSPTAPALVNDAGAISSSCAPGTPITINVLTNDVPNTATISFVGLNQGAASPAAAGVWTSTPEGLVTFTPDPNFNGVATITYTVSNTYGLSSTATISVTDGTVDVNGCTPNSVYGPSDINFITLAGYISSSSVTAAVLDGTQLDDNENLFSSTSSTGDYLDFGTAVANNLILDIGAGNPLRAKDTINIYWKNKTNAVATISIQIGTSSAGPWTNAQSFTSTSTSATVISEYALPTGTAGITHVKIAAGNVSNSTASGAIVYLDALEYEYLSCIPKNPATMNDAATVLEDQPTIINLLGNDNDPQGLSLTLKKITTLPSNGKVSVNTNGTVTYISTTDYSGTDNFSYVATNSEGYADTATVAVTIVDDNCTAGNYKGSGSGAITKIFQYGLTGTNAATANNTIGNFADGYIRSSKTTNSYGSSNPVQSGGISTSIRRALYQFNLTEIPSTAVIQSAIFTGYTTAITTSYSANLSLYRLTKTWVESTATWASAGGSNWTTAGGDFNATAEATTLVNAATTNFNWTITSLVSGWIAGTNPNYGFIQRSNEPTGSTSIYASFGSKENTTVNQRPKLTITYVVPVACAVIPNRAPLANPVYANTVSGQSVNIDPLSSCGDVDAANTVSLLSVFGATGSATATVSGSNIVYTPATSGVVPRVDRISYIIADNGTGTLKDTAYAYITVDNATPNVNKDLATTNSGTMVSIAVKTNDTDPEGIALTAPTIITAPKNGSALVSGNNIQYTPGIGFTGIDTLVYQSCESASGSCASTPLCDTALVIITVSNQTPTVANDAMSSLPCQEMRIDLTSNDADAENGILTVTNISALSNPAAGTLINNNDGTVNFTPAMGYIGTVTFTYTVTDDGNPAKTSSAATVTITIAAASNTAPLAVNDVADPSGLDETIYYPVLDNDSDPDGNSLNTPVITISPLHGIATVLPNGLIKYVPNTGYYGTDVLTYQICDIVLNPATCVGSPTLCATATLDLTVSTPGIQIAGSLWQDINGDVASNNGEADTNTGNTLYINLVDAAGNIVAVCTVAANGAYSFSQVNPGLTYSLVLSTSQGTVGQPAPSASLPSGWVNTGSNLMGTAYTSTPGVIGPITFGYSNTLNFNYGIEQLPSTDSRTTNIAQPSVGLYVTLNGGSNPPVLSGTDPEDCSGGCLLTGKSVKIDAVPANAELYYNGVLVVNNQVISNFNPALLQIKITQATVGSVSTSFQFSYVDLAGMKDPTPATYAITWFAPLPVRGLSLSATYTGNYAALDWKTVAEINSKHFILERSFDNQVFVPVGTIPAAGTSNALKNYHFNDNLAAFMQYAIIYYRVKMVEWNGDVYYSNVAIVRLSKMAGIQVWPNPFNTQIQVEWFSDISGNSILQLSDAVGKQILSEAHHLNKGNNQLQIKNLDNLIPGVYFLRVTNADQSQKIIKLEKF